MCAMRLMMCKEYALASCDAPDMPFALDVYDVRDVRDVCADVTCVRAGPRLVGEGAAVDP
eukprot:3938515-Rhodomonas_salina.2